MKRSLKIAAFLLAAVLLAGIFPAASKAEEAVLSGHIHCPHVEHGYKRGQ